MATEHVPIETYPERDVALAFRHAVQTGGRVRVSAGDVEYELEVHLVTETEADAEAERIARGKAAIRRATGAWKGRMDFDAFLEELYERRSRVDRPEVDLNR